MAHRPRCCRLQRCPSSVSWTRCPSWTCLPETPARSRWAGRSARSFAASSSRLLRCGSRFGSRRGRSEARRGSWPCSLRRRRRVAGLRRFGDPGSARWIGGCWCRWRIEIACAGPDPGGGRRMPLVGGTRGIGRSVGWRIGSLGSSCGLATERWCLGKFVSLAPYRIPSPCSQPTGVVG